METVALLGLSVVAALLAVLLRYQRPEQGVLIGLAAGSLILWAVIDRLTPLLTTVHSLLESSETGLLYSRVLIKGVGICLLTQAAADSCRDAGESSLAGKAELAGKISLLALSVPLFEEVLEQAYELMKGVG